MHEASPFLIQAPGVGLRGMGSSSLDFTAIIMIMSYDETFCISCSKVDQVYTELF